MNIYIIVEGEKATKSIYKKWIPLVNRQMRHIDYLHEFSNNNFYIFAGQGQPLFWDRVDKAVEDVNNSKIIDRLVVSVDSENKEYEEKLLEAKERIDKKGCRSDVRYIIQHFCLETWLLGNSDLFRKKTQNKDLRDYYLKFDIRKNDPENLPDYKEKSMNRAKFAYSYLRAGIKAEHGNRKFYNKSNAGIALEEPFFNNVRRRYANLNHIKSFKGFLDAFI